MNVINFPSHNKPIVLDGSQDTGELTEDYFNFFSMNNQETQQYFSQDGHLNPTRTDLELETLSTEQYTARIAYNGDTQNFMGNTAGEYKNFSQSMVTTRSDILAMTPLPDRIEQYSDEDNNLYTNVDGVVYQNPTVPATSDPVNFDTDGTELSVTINGTASDVVLTDTSTPIKFTSFDGTYLFLTINGTPRKIETLAP